MSVVPHKYDLESVVISAARKKIETLADDYRTRVLLPFCRRHRLTYLAGMGRTVFYARRRGQDLKTFGSADEAELEGYPEAVNVFAVLDQDAIGRNDCFGFYVADVTEKDIR